MAEVHSSNQVHSHWEEYWDEETGMPILVGKDLMIGYSAVTKKRQGNAKKREKSDRKQKNT